MKNVKRKNIEYKNSYKKFLQYFKINQLIDFTRY